VPYLPPIQQDQYPATDEVQCIQVKIPAGDEFKALLAGLMVSASDVNNYADPSSAAADGLAAIWDQAYSEIDWNGCIVIDGMPQIDLWTINAIPLAGVGTLSYNTSTAIPFGYAMTNANTTLYGMEQTTWFRAGEYNYSGWSSNSPIGGNTDVVITDGASVIDTIVSNLSQLGTFGTRVNSTGTFTIPADGFYRVVVANNGTGSGSNRQCNWTSHHIRRTGD